MYTLYISATSGKRLENYKTVVRIELMGTGANISNLYRFKKCDFDQAKLIAARHFFERIILPLEKKSGVDLTVCLDSHELWFDHKLATNDQFSETSYPQEWKELIELSNQLKLMVYFKEAGVLSMSMRDELQQELEKLLQKPEKTRV